MIGEITVVTPTAGPAATIRLHVPRAQIEAQMDPAIQELLQTLGAQGIAPSGPMYCYHYQVPDTHFDFDVGFPVPKAVTPGGRVEATQSPSQKAAKATFVGHYDRLYEAWRAFSDAMDAAGHEKLDGAESWEVYLKGPESSTNPAEWVTELYWPVK